MACAARCRSLCAPSGLDGGFTYHPPPDALFALVVVLAKVTAERDRAWDRAALFERGWRGSVDLHRPVDAGGVFAGWLH